MTPLSIPLSEQQARQTTSHLLMVRPAAFGFNEQTAESNAFQQEATKLSAREIQTRAQDEFDAFVAILQQKGITVTVFEDQPEPHTPDALFPNNWISFHEDGKIILYPIMAPNRRLERRWDIVEHFSRLSPQADVTDFSLYENMNQFLEGTGSMILDRVNQRVYACVSPRTDPDLFDRFCEQMDCQGIIFHAQDEHGLDIYHTNVMMALGHDLAVVCLDSIQNPLERQQLAQSLTETGHTILDINLAQVGQFAGNMLQIHNQAGESLWVLSQRAYDSLDVTQLNLLAKSGEPLPIPIDVIETYGGGGVRCMMAEVFLPKQPIS